MLSWTLSPRFGVIFDTISVKARWEWWCRWNCDLRVINAKKKRHFLSYRKRCLDTQITWPYAYYVTLGSCCKMANSSSEDETDTLPRETHKDTAISVCACQAGFWKSTRTSCHLQSKPHAVLHGVCEIALTEVLATQMGVMQRSKKVSSFELYKLNPLSPHCRLIARKLMHYYTWGHLRIVTIRGNTVGRHRQLFCRPHACTVYWRM